eukprot:767702-Hanusia_phi.AAC.3
MKIVVIGDLGQTIHSQVRASWGRRRGRRGEEWWWRRVQLMLCLSQHTMEKVESNLRASESSYAMGWIVGDLPYADGDGHRWDPWGRMMEPVCSSLPLMVLPGNHEIELDAQTSEVRRIPSCPADSKADLHCLSPPLQDAEQAAGEDGPSAGEQHSLRGGRELLQLRAWTPPHHLPQHIQHPGSDAGRLLGPAAAVAGGGPQGGGQDENSVCGGRDARAHVQQQQEPPGRS